MVCLGNICRSPLAEGILKKKVEIAGINCEVDSAGTSNYHIGESPDYRSIEKGNEYDVNIENLRARQFTVDDFDRFDLIYAMDTSNYNNIIGLTRDDADKNKVKLILNEIYPGENKNVPDPYYGGEDGFEHVYQLLDAACDKILLKLQ